MDCTCSLVGLQKAQRNEEASSVASRVGDNGVLCHETYHSCNNTVPARPVTVTAYPLAIMSDRETSVAVP